MGLGFFPSGLDTSMELGLSKPKPSDGFSPLEYAPIGWYDLSDISTLYQDTSKTTPVISDGDPIGAIEDKSENGNDILQGSTARKPTYKVGIQAGNSIARFDADDELPVPFSSSAANFTFFYAFNPTTIPSSARIFDISADRTIFTMSDSGTSEWGYYIGSFIFSGETASTGTVLAILDLRATNQASIRINGSSIYSGGTYSPRSITSGLNFMLKGTILPDLYELIIYKDLESTAIPEIEDYLNGKWGIY